MCRGAAMEGLDCKVNCRALGALLRDILDGSDGQVQTQGVSESAAVAAGRDRLRRPELLEEKNGTGTQAASYLVREYKRFQLFIKIGQ